MMESQQAAFVSIWWLSPLHKFLRSAGRLRGAGSAGRPVAGATVMQYGIGNNGVHWHIPFQEVGEERNRLLAKVDGMMPGDMPDFDPFLRSAVDTLTDGKYALTVKHCILISDGDPNYSGPGQKAVREMGDKGVTCTFAGDALAFCRVTPDSSPP